jgi:hypothetical protein
LGDWEVILSIVEVLGPFLSMLEGIGRILWILGRMREILPMAG